MYARLYILFSHLDKNCFKKKFALKKKKKKIKHSLETKLSKLQIEFLQMFLY